MALNRRTVVGVFDEPGLADRAVDALQNAGFSLQQISISSRHTDAGREHGGGFLEGLKRFFVGETTDTDAAPSDVKSDLTGMGLSDEAAGYYEEQYKHGRSVIAVRAENRFDDALSILRSNGGHDFGTRPGREQDAPGVMGSSSATGTPGTMTGSGVNTGAATPPVTQEANMTARPDMVQQNMPASPMAQQTSRPADTPGMIGVDPSRTGAATSPSGAIPARPLHNDTVSPNQQAYQERTQRSNEAPTYAQTTEQPRQSAEGSVSTGLPQEVNAIDEQRIRERRVWKESEEA